MKQTACTNDELWTIVMGGCHRAQIRPLFRLYMSRYKVNHNVNFKVYDLAFTISLYLYRSITRGWRALVGVLGGL